MKKKVTLIGASTGGPSQIKTILHSLTSLSYTIIIALHMKEEVLPFFIKDLQETLKFKVYSTPLKISFDEPSIVICSQSSIIRHKSFGYEIVSDLTNQKYTPDINKLFLSFAAYASDFDLKVILMTGIGNDGVEGAVKLKSLGAKVIVEHEKSCAVYGMPRVALESGIVDEVKTLDELTELLRELS